MIDCEQKDPFLILSVVEDVTRLGPVLYLIQCSTVSISGYSAIQAYGAPKPAAATWSVGLLEFFPRVRSRANMYGAGKTCIQRKKGNIQKRLFGFLFISIPISLLSLLLLLVFLLLFLRWSKDRAATGIASLVGSGTHLQMRRHASIAHSVRSGSRTYHRQVRTWWQEHRKPIEQVRIASKQHLHLRDDILEWGFLPLQLPQEIEELYKGRLIVAESLLRYRNGWGGQQRSASTHAHQHRE